MKYLLISYEFPDGERSDRRALRRAAERAAARLDTQPGRAHTSAMAKTTNRKPAGGSSSSNELPAVADFIETLDTCVEMCGAVLAVKSTIPTNRIAATIRTQMRGLSRLAAYWTKQQRTLYAGLVEAAAITGGGGTGSGRAKRAGAGS
jgi:hypothetical protein